jgi:hypothetical protein
MSHTPKFNHDAFYLIDGEALDRIWRISYRFNDGIVMSPDERRDLAQEIQALLNGRPIKWRHS